MTARPDLLDVFHDRGCLALLLDGLDDRQGLLCVGSLRSPPDLGPRQVSSISRVNVRKGKEDERDVVQVAKGVDVEDVGEAGSEEHVLREAVEHVPRIHLSRVPSRERPSRKQSLRKTDEEDGGEEVDAEGGGEGGKQDSVGRIEQRAELVDRERDVRIGEDALRG